MQFVRMRRDPEMTRMTSFRRDQASDLSFADVVLPQRQRPSRICIEIPGTKVVELTRHGLDQLYGNEGIQMECGSLTICIDTTVGQVPWPVPPASSPWDRRLAPGEH